MAGINRGSVGRDFNKRLRESIFSLMKMGISDPPRRRRTLKALSSFITERWTETGKKRFPVSLSWPSAGQRSQRLPSLDGLCVASHSAAAWPANLIKALQSLVAAAKEAVLPSKELVYLELMNASASKPL